MRAKLCFSLLLGAACSAWACDDSSGNAGGVPLVGASGQGGGGSGAGGGAGGAGGDASGAGGSWSDGPPSVRQIDANGLISCALGTDGSVRCWGRSLFGQLGYGHVDDIGDNETPAQAGAIDLGGKALQISVGGYDEKSSSGHSCALLEGGLVRCWGRNQYGQLGYGHVDNVGDNEAPTSAGSIDLGGKALQIAAGRDHTCALLEGGLVRCWGGYFGVAPGYGFTDTIGDDEAPASAALVDLGGKAVQIAAGYEHACALLEGGSVRCWGNNYKGALGYGFTDNVGDNEAPSAIAPADLGGKALKIEAGMYFTCALLEGGSVRCWGENLDGQLGLDHEEPIGDNEAPASAAPVNLGGKAIDVVADYRNACALLEDGSVRCWGDNFWGQLGSEGPTDADPSLAGFSVDAGGKVVQIALGSNHSCVLLEGGAMRCWGANSNGQLGYGTADGFNGLPPAQMDDVQIF